MIPLSRAEEAQLVARLRRRDEKAFRLFVRHFEAPVYNLVLRMLGHEEEARDVSQEVFVTVFRAIADFREESKLSTWLFRIVTNHCRNRQKYLGRRSYGRTDSFEEALDSAEATVFGERPVQPDRALEGERLERALQAAIAGLDPEHRELVVLRDIQGLSYEEIRKVTGLAEGTVKSRLHRARMTLKEKLEALVGPPDGAE